MRAVPPPADAPPGIDRLKTEFLASLNHEIRTPLSGIIGMLDLLAETRLERDQNDYVNSARVCAEELLGHLNAAVEYSALASGQLALERSRFNLPETLASIAASYAGKAKARGLLFLASIAPELPGLVIGDAGRLRHILTHLLDNALKFTPSGEVELAASGVLEAPGAYRLRLAVRDTGIGIPACDLDAIFEVFRQLDTGLGRKYSGMGLGLALVRELVRLMGGEVRVSSAVGQGSTFEVIVPIEIARDAAAPSGAGRARILLVEDNELSQRIAAYMLRRAHFNVDVAGTGPEALAAAREARYDIILMDLQMPEMDGLETARAIRAVPGCEAVPIVALTAHTSEEYRSHCLANGMQDFISKPLRAEELLGTVKRLATSR